VVKIQSIAFKGPPGGSGSRPESLTDERGSVRVDGEEQWVGL